MYKYGAYLGRLNPIHLGHEVIAREMIGQFGVENSLMLIGSSNAIFSLRNFFSYEERRGFAKRIFPDIKMVGLPDYSTDREWLTALDDLLFAVGFNPEEVIFFGGCEEDLRFFLDADRDCYVINRFDGSTPKISATEIRDCLIHSRPVEDMLNPLIAEEVREIFLKKWEKFKKI